jgi:formamidopyrimidine-DNA glycosylase
VTRRAKYLLLTAAHGTVIVHLGMSGSLRVVDHRQKPQTHDHVDIVFDDGQCLRLRDPRRFGCVLWTRDIQRHPLLSRLGPEPLDESFDANYLFKISRTRKRAIRDFLLDGTVVAGIGNIYANEALFAAGVRPTRLAGRLTLQECRRLVRTIRTVLRRAVTAGGTTLRDFQNHEGEPGYFQFKLNVYGLDGQPCRRCRTTIRHRQIGQRSAFYCSVCQL